MLNKPNSSEVRDKIVASARDLFMKKGLKGTTVRDIAADSGTNVAMVNYYFQSKDKLFETIFEESFGVLVAKVFSALDSDLPFFEIIRKWVYTYYDTLLEEPQLPIFVFTELSRNPDLFAEKFRLKNPYQIYSKLAIRINEEEKKGTIRKVNVSSLLLNVVSLGVFPFLFSPVATAFLKLSKEEYVELVNEHKENVVEFIINAIKIRD